MGKIVDRISRQILINPHTSGTTAPAGKLNLGEIAVQHDSTSGASLWIETVANSDSENTLVRFMNASAVTALVESARTDLQTEIDSINDAVGLPHSSGEFSGRVVWDAIEQIYDELVASAAAATTYVVTGDTEDTGKYLKITDALDEHTSAHTYTISLSGISNDIEAVDDKVDELSGAVETFSAATVAEFNSAFTAIQAMDKDAEAVAGQVVTTISQTDGKVTETKANVKDLQLGGYVKDAAATGDIASTDTINAALSKLENKAAAITIANADGSINVTTAATGTDINVNIKTGEKVLAKDGNAGLYTDLDLVKITTGLPAEIKERYQLLATDDSQIGVNIDVPKDSHIVSITFISDPADAHYQNLEYKYIDTEGVERTTYVDISSLVLEAEFASGVTVTNHIAHGVVDPATEKDSNDNAFLTVGAAGFKVDGIKNEINTKIAALDVTDTAEAGKYVSAVNETDGKVSMTRANVSDAVLNGYAKGEKPASTAVVATDDVKGAIAKLEHQIDDAKAAATTKVVEGVDNPHMVITSAQSQTDGSMTYTITLTDVASESALTTEIAARKAVDGQSGSAYTATTTAKYISGATSLNDADVKLDTAVASITKSAVTAAEFGTVTTKDPSEEGSNAGIEVVANGESKKIVLDLSLLKIDCGEY